MVVNTLDVVLISGVLTLIGSLLSWFLARADKRSAHFAESTTPGVPTVQQIWERQDKLERDRVVMDAALRACITLLSEIAEQWDSEKQPELSRQALDTLRKGGYLPAEFESMFRRRMP